MKGIWGGPAGKLYQNGKMLIAAFVLMFPGSAEVLCMAQGGHIAIEDINVLCHTSFSASAPHSSPWNNGFGLPDSCRNCTDIFLTPNGRPAASRSFGSVAAGAHADDFLGYLLCAVSFLPLSFADITPVYIDTSPPPTASRPMRR